MSGFCFQKWRWVIPPKYLFLKNVGNRLEFIIMDFVSVNDAPWPSQMALDFVSKNDARWDTRTFDCFQLWPLISSRDDVTHVMSHHARTHLPTPYLPHMTPLSDRHVWHHKWRKAIFGFCFREWRWVKYPKCCQYGLIMSHYNSFCKCEKVLFHPFFRMDWFQFNPIQLSSRLFETFRLYKMTVLTVIPFYTFLYRANGYMQ